MNIKVQRFCKHRDQNTIIVSYELPVEECTLLEALYFIKEKVDPTLTFNSGCRSEICGSCAVRVNGREKLACAYKLQEGDTIEPLSKTDTIKDLVVDHTNALHTLKRVESWLNTPSQPEILMIEDEKLIEKQTDCILCSCCFSACPVLETDKAFLGPFALTRSYRYTSDKRAEETKHYIDLVQNKGIWDCTLCGECTAVCPQGIDPKMDIMMLRSQSTQYGYTDPNFTTGSNDMFGSGFDPGF